MVSFEHIPCEHEVSQGFGHFFPVNIHIAIVHPVPGERLPAGAFRLGDFIFMVGKNQIFAAAMDIKGLAQ